MVAIQERPVSNRELMSRITSVATYRTRPICDVHPKRRTSVIVEGLPICSECWRYANLLEKSWYKKVAKMYTEGLLTRAMFDSYVASISAHIVDPSILVCVRE